MNWKQIWEAVHGFLSGMADPDRWKMSVNGKREGEVTCVQFAAAGAAIDFTVNGKAMKLEAVPYDAKHAGVKVNGKLQPEARLTFGLRHQPLRPVILVFEFKNVTVGAETNKYRFDFPK